MILYILIALLILVNIYWFLKVRRLKKPDLTAQTLPDGDVVISFKGKDIYKGKPKS